MTLEMAVGLGSFAVALGGVSFVVWVMRSTGMDRTGEPELVRNLIETAPYERLDNVLTPKR